ncbi:MAG: hypothetical protein FWB86_14575 [Treponema sp.]|nr:hypothetical protein [Treponema sp.]
MATYKDYMDEGLENYNYDDFTDAIYNFGMAASVGKNNEEIAEAFFYIGKVYHTSRNDIKQATEFYKKSADYGNKAALQILKTFGIDYAPVKPAASGGTVQKPSSSTGTTYNDYYSKGYFCLSQGEYDEAIDNINKAISLATEDWQLDQAYEVRGSAYTRKGNHQQGIADYKKAADYGNTETIGYLKQGGINYTPQKPSASTASQAPKPAPQPSSSSSSTPKPTASPKPVSSSNGFLDFLENIGFKNANYPEDGLNIFLSILLGIVIAAGVWNLARQFISGFQVIIYSVVVFVIAFASLRWTNKMLIIVLSILGAIGAAEFLLGFI